MDLVGDEKRILTLFCELKLEDQSLAPEFENVWRRAQTARPERRATLERSLVVITAALLITTLSSLILWSRSRHDQQSTETVGHVSSPDLFTSVTASIHKAGTVHTPKKPHRVRAISRVQKLTAGRKTHTGTKDSIMQIAVAISTWQSPTATLVQSPASSAFRSLPQLNESVEELKTFLPNQ